MFEGIDQAVDAVESLRRHGFASADVSHFANNPPGQHDRFPIGGDENMDPGARHAHAGAAAGAGVGAGAGAAVGAVVAGPPGAAVGAGIGAYVGSLAGALNKLEGEGTQEQPTRRPAGVIVAARAASVTSQQVAIGVLQAEGATHIEKTEGQWLNGTWSDFDPVSEPRLVRDLPPGPRMEPRGDDVPACEVRRDPGTGKWEVLGPTRGQRQAGFDSRQDAVSHAAGLAAAQGAAVEVYGKDGELIWREIHGREAAPRRSASR
jgi:hypothetical protein